MGDSRKGKSIWKRYDKPRGEKRVESDGKLFYRIDKKTGRTVTNLLEWERSWKNVKILKYPTRFARSPRCLGLTLGRRVHQGLGFVFIFHVLLRDTVLLDLVSRCLRHIF